MDFFLQRRWFRNSANWFFLEPGYKDKMKLLAKRLIVYRRIGYSQCGITRLKMGAYLE